MNVESSSNMLQPGRVIKAHSGFFSVYMEPEGIQVICRAAGKLTKGKHSEDALAVGDRVLYEVIHSGGDIQGRIEVVLPRGHVLARKDPIAGTKNLEIKQVIVANLDQVIFVFSCAQPDFHSRMLDRYLVGAEAQGLPVLICATKTDLVGYKEAKALFAVYEKLGYHVIYTSVIDNGGIAELHNALRGRLSVLTGKSGVGKSSLLNVIKPGLELEIRTLSTLWHKGLHTTVVPELFQLDSSSWIADTPGLRSYAIWDVEAEEVDAYYREMAPLVQQCAFSDCTHTHEPGCAVQNAVKEGLISFERYESYRRLYHELARQRKW